MVRSYGGSNAANLYRRLLYIINTSKQEHPQTSSCKVLGVYKNYARYVTPSLKYASFQTHDRWIPSLIHVVQQASKALSD
jgi:hypothetical protein